MWWPIRRPIVETVSLTAIGVDGVIETRTVGLGLGQAKAKVISLPAGVRAVKIERPARVRVDLGRIRSTRQASLRPRRPNWRDDSDLWLRWEHWRAESVTRRAYRRRQGR
jgi:hypothetical protein